MAFMILKTIVFQKKITFYLRSFAPVIVCLLPSLFNYKPNMKILLSREGLKWIDVTKFKVFKEFVKNLMASTRALHKK